MMQATKLDLTPLADALRDVIITGRRKYAASTQDKSVVMLLAHLMDVGPMRAHDLAGHACLDPSTVSRHLRSLESDGLVGKAPDPEDGRAMLLQVTDAGVELVAQARIERIELLSAAVSDWPAKDVAALTRLTRRLADSLENL